MKLKISVPQIKERLVQELARAKAVEEDATNEMRALHARARKRIKKLRPQVERLRRELEPWLADGAPDDPLKERKGRLYLKAIRLLTDARQTEALIEQALGEGEEERANHAAE